VLSTVTAIRATSAILADDGPIDPEWQDRFHRNLYEDSQRLADSAQGLVGYLDGPGQSDASLASSPQEEVDAWLTSRGHYLAPLEDGQGTPEQVVPDMVSGAARALMLAFAHRYAEDARAMPLSGL